MIVAGLCGWAFSVAAQNDEEALAKQLSNPIASLISLPFQLNYDEGYGLTGDGKKTFANVQPVIPISINEEWNLISRTIVPLVYNDDIIPGEENFGVGNILQSLFFSPVAPTAAGWIWGVGPAIQIPVATRDEFGPDAWALGPTAVALRQGGPWTVGILANHLWDVDDDIDINNTYLQPFLNYTTPSAWTFGINSESSYDWEAEQWNAPINLLISKTLTINKQPIQIQGGLRYWMDAPESGPDDVGFRFAVTYLFPK